MNHKELGVSVSPDQITSNGGSGRNSSGKAKSKTPPSLLNRASTGSCHDFCKYGRKHAFEIQERRPRRLRFSGNHEIQGKKIDQGEVLTPGVRKKRLLQKLKNVSQQEIQHSHQSKVKQDGLLAPDDYQLGEVHEGGKEESAEESIIMVMKAPLFPLNSISSSSDHRHLDEAEGFSGELEGPSFVEKSIVTSELIAGYQVERSIEEITGTEFAVPSCPRRSQSGLSLPVDEERGLFEEHVFMEEMEISPVLESIIEFAETTKTNQQEGSAVLSMKLKSTSPVEEYVVTAADLPTNRSEELSDESMGKEINQVDTLAQKSVNISPKILSSIKGSTGSAEKKFPASKQSKTRSLEKGEPKKREVTKLWPSSNLLKNATSMKTKVISSKETGQTLKPSSVKQKTVSPIKRSTPTVRPKLIKQETAPSLKKTTQSSTKRILKSTTPSPSKKTDTDANTSFSFKPNIPVAKSISSPTPAGSSGTRSQQSKASKNQDNSKINEKKVLKPLRASLSPRSTLNRVSSSRLRKYGKGEPASNVKNAKKKELNKAKAEEKTLYIIEPKGENGSMENVQSKSSQTLMGTSASDVLCQKEENEDTESTYTEASESASEDAQLKRKTPVDSLKVGDMRMIRRSAGIRAEDKVQAPHKLKFCRGKVVDLQAENNAPRRLRFRRSRVATENQSGKGELGRRSFKKRSEFSGSGTTGVGAPTVVLRHQDQQEKKDTQGLFNHVIEETASKLVETRKSKVKALVGAFETVISLQESKVALTV